jgi:putative ABC transport system permease protein
MRDVLQDVIYELRVLARNRGFAAIAILTLALGIGADTALFSVVNGVLLNPLPFRQPDRLVGVSSRTDSFDDASVSFLNLLDWKKDNKTFEAMAGYRGDDFNLTGSGEPERLRGRMISAEFFPLLGVPPVVGRDFRPEEDVPGAAPVAMISDGLWKSRFGRSPEVVGKSVMLSGQAYTVVGVAPERMPLFGPTQVYVLLGQWNDPTFRDRHIGMGTRVVGRLKPGVSIEQARADMHAIAGALAQAYPDSNKGSGVTLVQLKTQVVGDVRGILLVLLGAVSFVLLIACANVANLLLARSTGRMREFAIRAALGAGPWRVIRQLLTESVLLGMAGGALGLLVAKAGTQSVLASLPEALPRGDEIAMDWRVLLFTAGLSVLTGVLFGLAPALSLLRPKLTDTLKEGGRGSSAKRHRLQSVLVAGEMAMALVLLVGAGLMIRSLAALWGVDPGFDTRNALSFGLSLTAQSGATADQLRAKYRESLRQFESVPGIERVSMIGGSLPMTGDSEVPFWLEGQPKPATQAASPFALFYLVTPGYREAMGIPLQRGRFISDRDDEHSPAVVVIDAAFARKYYPNSDPVGQYLNIGLLNIHPQIVGVAGHVEHWGLGDRGHEALQSQLYLPVWQVPDQFWPLLSNGSGYIARTAPHAEVLGGLRAAAARFDGSAVVYEATPMREIVAGSISTQRLAMLLLSVFSSLALLLSAIGIYGVISYFAGQSTHEIGIRLALGATRGDVLKLVLGDGMKIALVGVGIGLAAALGLSRLITGLIYGVSATDPPTFAGVAILLAGVALLACYVPARRATRVDPMVVLRCE